LLMRSSAHRFPETNRIAMSPQDRLQESLLLQEAHQRIVQLLPGNTQLRFLNTIQQLVLKDRAIFGLGHWLSPLCLFQQQHSGASNDLFQLTNCELYFTLSILCCFENIQINCYLDNAKDCCYH